MSGQASTSAPPAPLPTDQAADRRQLDLFIDGGDALLIHEIVTGLISRDVGRTEAGLHRLGQEHARHPDLGALTVLVEALTPPVPAAATHAALTERTLVPATRRFLGTDADAFLRPVWQALATAFKPSMGGAEALPTTSFVSRSSTRTRPSSISARTTDQPPRFCIRPAGSSSTTGDASPTMTNRNSESFRRNEGGGGRHPLAN